MGMVEVLHKNSAQLGEVSVAQVKFCPACFSGRN